MLPLFKLPHFPPSKQSQKPFYNNNYTQIYITRTEKWIWGVKTLPLVLRIMKNDQQIVLSGILALKVEKC